MKQKLAIAAFVMVCLVTGLVVGSQALKENGVSTPPAEAPAKPASHGEQAEQPTGPRVSQGIEPQGWIDLDRADLSDLMHLPGMTRNRAVSILELRKSKPDLSAEDLLGLPDISKQDVDSWKPFLWERDQESPSSDGRR